MKLFRKNAADLKESQIAMGSSTLNFMAPCDYYQNMPCESSIISHERNSHTLRPKIVGGPDYYEQFNQLQDHYLIDFPGIFESRGPELDIAIRLSLQQILFKSKSAKVLLLVSAMVLAPDQNSIITLIRQELSLMFKEPEKHVVIGITKTRLVQNTIGEDEIVSVAQGENGENISFKGYDVLIVEQDDTATIQEMLQMVMQKGCIKNNVRMGFIDENSIMKIFEREKLNNDIYAF